MEILWAPWRMRYVAGERPAGCIFCVYLAEGDDPKNLILHRGEGAFVILNAHPYSPGHVMVVVNRHVAGLEELTEAEGRDLLRLAQRSLAALRAALRPDGFNVGANLGRVAGAGIEGHFHVHVVPRWEGDTNFMPVIGSVKVLPEGLESTYARLSPHFSP
ncbi:MAG: HIT domain-containing protein [Candidatus Rokubacteria bacterium]|nr:HIT domain-containing protein [Candidatus Rokubacteria bacterium]